MDRFHEKYGQWALVTGATSGTGLEFAKQLADKGMHSVARGKKALLETENFIRDHFHVEVKIIAADLSNPDSVAEIAYAGLKEKL